MHCRIEDTFHASLTRLQNHEQKAVKTTFFDLVRHPAAQGLRLKKLQGGSWSARVNEDIRIILDWNEDDNSLTLRYVGHHDAAYQWADAHKTKIRPENAAAKESEALQPALQTAHATASAKPAKTIRFRLLSFAARTVDTCATPLSALRDAIVHARDAQNGQLPGENRNRAKGAAEVRKVFEISDVGTVAGCYVTEGKIALDDQIRIIRGGAAVHEGRIDSLKQREKRVREIRRGSECGVGVWSYPNIQIGDRIESY